MPDRYPTKKSRAKDGNCSSDNAGRHPDKPAEPDLSLGSQEYLLRALIDHVPDYLFAKDTRGRFVLANPAVAVDLGLSVADLIGKTDFDLHRRELAEKFFADEQAVIRSGKPIIDTEEFVVTASGQKKWLATSKLPLRNPGGTIIGVVGVCRDITEQKRAEEALAESESRWNFALEGAGQGVWDHNVKDGTAYFSPTWRKMRGIGLDEPVDPSREAWLARVHPDDRERLIGETDQQNSGKLRQNAFEYRERHRDGHYIWILSRGEPVELMPDGSVARIIGTDTDISSLKAAEARAAEEKEQTYRRHLAALEKAHEATDAAHRLAESLARHDALTGLPNRRVFAETLENAVSRARRDSVSYCVMIVDLDRFKPVNDINGHAAGDVVLREIATRLGDLSRAGDVVARLGGDEFGIIVESDTPELATEAASALATRIIASIGRPISIGDQIVEVGASIGISICPNDGTNSDTLLRTADMAMYRAKEEGRGAYRFFALSMENALRERTELEQDVRRAVLEHEIFPHYQPLMLLAENRLVGFEILARWHHATRGEVGPDVFIPIVEKLNLIDRLTYDLLRRACLDARDWPRDITISLNISPLHFSDPLLPVKLLSILSETDFPPQRLEIEVTETSLVADIDAARAALVALQDIGIKISLDDFGTGYSSLYNLRELHFDKIKIDRSFISSMQSNAGSAKIVGSVIDLAKSLGLPVIAEGIEHWQEMQEIIKRGGEYGQGFYFGKAIPAGEATAMAQGGSANKLNRA
ncbi:sensor domain-containing protein [Nitratireductor thuwali]|uniref:Signaling protein n=1 Tax=Nitratireductor thuwali TaxID=2267699 RepID=A0ABY5MM96_9HYPH|nr:putative signaling protein [Nitratireductor thuwali]